GEIRAVIGPNGAGKSTLFNLITSVLKPHAGEVVFAGENITGLPVYRVARKGIARTFQLCHIFPALSASENVRLAAQARDARRAGDLSVLLVEHDMEVVFKLADNITVLHRGRVIADGAPAAVKADAAVRSAYLGGAD